VKKKLVLMAVLMAALVSGCTSKTDFGQCVGAFDDKNPALTYKLDVGNAVVGVLFSGLILPPVLVIADETFCPVGRK
jgi:hypothetical protein